MEKIKDEYQMNKIKASLKDLYVIVTNGSKRIANIAIISDVEVMNTNDDLILHLIGNIKNTENEIFVNVHGVFYKLSFKIVLADVSNDILKKYMFINQGRINYSYDLFEFGRFDGKIKQVKSNNTMETFLNWYDKDRGTNQKILFYDGIWICGNYLKIISIFLPNVQFDISNDSQLFNSNKTNTIII